VDPSDALATLLMTAGLPIQRIPLGLAARAALWRDHLVGKRVLLLLLDDAVSSDQVRPLLPGDGSCLVLLTSRRHLAAMDDAHTISLNALPQLEAAELLVRLAGRPGLDSGDDAVIQIARLCGYLPLAVGMLARQLHHHPAWTCARLAADLAAARNRLDLMHAEDQSVSAAFDLSYQDLSAEQRRLFRYLGLHQGSDIDAYAAAALGGTELAVARRNLEAIYDQYLLSEPTQGRYLMHDLMREHARALTVSEDQRRDADQAVGRLLDYYERAAQAADRLMTRYTRPDPASRLRPDLPAGAAPAAPAPAAPAAIPALRDDLQALSWARAERASLLAGLDQATEAGQHARVVALTAALAALLRHDGPWAEAITRHHSAIAAARHIGDQLAQAAALADLGDLLRATGDSRGAALALDDALGRYTDLGDRLGQANTMTDLAALHATTGDYRAAVGTAQQALDLYRDLGDRLGQARSLSFIGYARCRAGQDHEAVPPLEDSLGLYRDLGNRLGLASTLNYLAVARRGTGHLDHAAATLEAALAIHRDIGNRSGQASVLVDMGGLRRETGDYQGAAQALAAAMEILHEIDNPNLLSEAHSEMAALHRVRSAR
jgi:tetratricopeptide (TPR) repeat protein